VQPALAGLGLDRLFGDVHDGARGERLAVALLEGLGLFAGEEVEVVLPEEILALDAEQVLARAIEALEAQSLRFLHEDHVGDVLDDRVEKAVGALVRFFRLP